MSALESMTPYAQQEAQSARTFALIAFVFFAVLTAIWAVVYLVILIGVMVVSGMAGVMPMGLFFPLIFPMGIWAGLNVGLTFWSWSNLKDIDAGRLQKAETASLVMGILGLIANIISGIFMLLAYTKLNSAIRYATTPPPAYQPAYQPPPPAGRMCTSCGRAVTLDAKFCPHCGAELPA